MALYRAAELTIENGYSHFVVTKFQGFERRVGLGYGTPTDFAGDEVSLIIEFQNDGTVPHTFTEGQAQVFDASETIIRLQSEIDARQ